MSLMELALSEFRIPRAEYLFEWSVPNFSHIINARIERNQAAKDKPPAPDEPPEYSSIRKLRGLAGKDGSF